MENKALIYEAIPKVMADIDPVAKSKENRQQGYKFRGIDDVYNEVHSILAKHQVFTVPEVLSAESEERKSSSGSTLIYRRLRIKYRFYAVDGSYIEAIVVGEGMDSGDKASNKAMAVAHKYALLQVLAIPTAEDKDPEHDSHQVEEKKPFSKPPQTIDDVIGDHWKRMGWNREIATQDLFEQAGKQLLSQLNAEEKKKYSIHLGILVTNKELDKDIAEKEAIKA